MLRLYFLISFSLQTQLMEDIALTSLSTQVSFGCQTFIFILHFTLNTYTESSSPFKMFFVNLLSTSRNFFTVTVLNYRRTNLTYEPQRGHGRVEYGSSSRCRLSLEKTPRTHFTLSHAAGDRNAQRRRSQSASAAKSTAKLFTAIEIVNYVLLNKRQSLQKYPKNCFW